MNDKSKAVQYSAIKSINIITEECALSFLNHPNFLDILKLIVGKLTISSNFLSHTCKIIDNLCEMWKPKSKVSAVLSIVDIAGLVAGASTGEGLGNAFLSHISATDGIFHVVRAFEDEEIVHTELSVGFLNIIKIL